MSWTDILPMAIMVGTFLMTSFMPLVQDIIIILHGHVILKSFSNDRNINKENITSKLTFGQL